MKHSDSRKDKKQKPPQPEGEGGEIVSFRKPKKNPAFDVAWFYEEEEFFAEHMDEFDW